MPTIGRIYECPICGNAVKILTDGNTPLVCCGQPMEEVASSESEFFKLKGEEDSER
ncbi:desulfoferrodoxin FeS4 iron-binding domain-containing protein [Pseudomonadota bacterium]